MSDKINKSLSDDAIIKSIGEFVSHHRLQQNKSQTALAEESGISRSALSDMEKGVRFNIMTLVKVLRMLNKLDALYTFEFTNEINPLVLAELEAKQRQRASKSQPKKDKPKSDW
jgi:transcriptional regulator with XRE-family HTH domain